MESSTSPLMFLALVVVHALTISLCTCCLEQERTALLQIKASMSQYPNDPYFFESWDSAGYEGGGSSDCCAWQGVECNITTAKVIKLDLSFASFHWPLNASMFLPFKDLTHLDLIANFISTWVPNQGLGRLSVLPKLKTLLLDGNRFNSTILPSLGELSSLKLLSLRENDLEGSFDFGEFQNTTNLHELDLGRNYIDNIEGLGRLDTLDRLEVLKLDGNYFNNSILPSLGLHSTLKVLSLGDNRLIDEFNVRELLYTSNLEELDLSDNDITEVNGLERLSKLSVLYLRELRLNESSSSAMQLSVSAMRSLKALDISRNNLRGLTFANSSFGFSNLLELDLSYNNLEGMIPSWLRNFTSLRYLDLSNNTYEGNLALSPLADLSALECLIISNNNLKILVSLASFFNHSKLKILVTDNNALVSDKVEFHLPKVMPKFQLQFLSFSNCGSNNLITRLPDFFRYQSDLRVVDISQVNLAMSFPNWLFENNTLLKQFKMRNNSLGGSFLLPSHRRFPRITVIDISNNHLGGQVLENFVQLFPGLCELNMSSNLFGGYIPSSIGKLKYLEILDLSNNYLSGDIPTIDSPKLFVLKLSHNNLSGQLSSLYNLSSLVLLYLDENKFVGNIPDTSPLFSLWGIDLSKNYFSGKLPRWVGNMSELSSIAMASNYLEGSIPVEFCKHGNDQLEYLDLSDNSLSDSIPPCLNPQNIQHVHLKQNKFSGPMTSAFHNCSSLVTLDLHDNYLTGLIPRWIGNLSLLSVLILKLNNFEGEIPLELCNLENLSMLSLSHNSLSGRLPPCLSNMPIRISDQKSSAWGITFYSSSGFLLYYQYSKRLKTTYYFRNPIYGYDITPASQQVEFSTKFGSFSYQGTVLNLMSGIDLSCNYLTGEIPTGLGNLSNIHSLNLSHNNLTGPIPTTFSKLTAIESLDLSYNNLNGRIPPQLVELVSLGSFSVAHNNLSGPVPDTKAQFGTFDEKSYEGNPQLCGPPLLNNCSTGTEKGLTKPQAPAKEVEHDDMVDFYASCGASYVTVLITISAVLLINPRWRCAWFNSIEVWMTASYYFVMNAFCKLVNRRMVI